jgi:tRNA-2-methylthio-N6-dimethylallyladenosine synthase
VHFENNNARPGDIAEVRITDASAHYLIGDLISVRTTRGGDAHHARTAERKPEPLLMGIPTRKA